ncbi:MAG: ATP-binding cassette domain-containing protein [Steroidobacteraceae bacterium]
MTTVDARGAPLLEASDLHVRYPGADDVLHGLSLAVEAGGSLGICGESGSGKSTLLRAVLGLTAIRRGEVRWRGQPISRYGAAEWQALRRVVQPVFQDPLASLDPRLRVGDILAEPLRVHEPRVGRGLRDARIASMLQRVGLAADAVARYPHELSGGQCQRVGIARAMMLAPEVLVCDEPVSALDVSIQAQILALLQSLQREAGVTLIFVSHNLAIVRRLCAQVIILRGGAIVEAGRTAEVLDRPRHAYTRQLIASVPAVPRRLAGR